MRIQTALTWLAMLTLVGCWSGCGKSDNQPAPVPEPKKPAPAQPAKPLVSTRVETAALTNADAVSDLRPLPVAAVSTLVEAAPLTTPVDAPKAVSVPPPTTAPVRDQPSASLASLSQDQVVLGLREALTKGLQQAITRLGHDGGFLTNLEVRIPLPEKLHKVETALRAIKEEKLADEFVATMNHAAEQAVPEAGVVFTEALSHMTIQDAKSILAGPDDAATRYFERTTQTNLYARFYPIVQKATRQTGVTAAYQKFMEKANLTNLSTRLGGLGNLLEGALNKESLDLDEYVTNKAMEGLFKTVAEEEKRIRQNPVARTTDLLQKVFGALKR